ncbi:hypothetical protein ACHAXS_008631 [Conticribra weissflogii]
MPITEVSLKSSSRWMKRKGLIVMLMLLLLMDSTRTFPKLILTTNIEYISISSALCNIITIAIIIEKIKQQGFKILCTLPYFYCKILRTIKLHLRFEVASLQ